jgi:hypothetical protein
MVTREAWRPNCHFWSLIIGYLLSTSSVSKKILSWSQGHCQSLWLFHDSANEQSTRHHWVHCRQPQQTQSSGWLRPVHVNTRWLSHRIRGPSGVCCRKLNPNIFNWTQIF